MLFFVFFKLLIIVSVMGEFIKPNCLPENFNVRMIDVFFRFKSDNNSSLILSSVAEAFTVVQIIVLQ